jgi:uncharacterized membrane protein YGL010W
VVSARIAASKRTAARVGLALAVVGSAAQVVGYTVGEGDAPGFTALMYAGVVVAAAGAVAAWSAIIGGGPRVVASTAIVVAVAPVVVLVVATALAQAA